MSLIRYQPLGGPLFGRDRGFAGFGNLGRLHNEINRLFDSYESSDDGIPVADWTPAVDVTEEDKRYVLHADVPGVDPKDIEVTLEEGVLTVRGSRSDEKKETSSDERGNGYRRVERVTGNFFRRFSLPDTADADRISAETKNGVLEVVIPKQPKVEPRRITVKG